MRRLAVIGCVLLAVVPLGRAQQAPSIDPAAIPIEQEPRHRLVFANEFVRIIDALLPPLYVSQNHTHTYDNVAVTILPGTDGPQAQARIGFAGYSRGGYSHIITNPNTGPMRFIAVELRAPDHSVESEELPQGGHVSVLGNARVHIARVKLAAGESLASHQHAAGYVSIVVRGSEPAGTWRWHAAGEPAASLDAGRQALEIVEVEPK
ncbi:MAG TPA: hypothetical protein VM032_12775 [Vicinamibacterales bacterium]|nr:hypothetical protein [Vicinamibacterales bacterium]